MDRAEAEAIYGAGQTAVVETLLRMDRELRQLRSAAAAAAGSHSGAPGHRLQLPTLHQGVTLIPPSGDHIPAQVKERYADALVLVVMIRIAPLTDEELAGMLLEFAVADGRIHLHGTFTCADADAPEVLHLGAPAIADLVQQREFLRVDVVRRVHVLLAAKGAEPIPSHTVNLGVGGALLDGPRILEVGDHVRFEIAIVPGEPPVVGSGRVLRKDEHGRPGIVFDAIEPSDLRRLRHYIGEFRLEEGFGEG